MRDILDILISPNRLFARLSIKPEWFLPFVAASFAQFMVSWMKSCGAKFPSIEPWSILWPAISAPIMTLSLWSALSLFLSLASYLLNSKLTAIYKKIFSVVAYCGVIYLLGETANFLLIRNEVIGETPYPIPGRFPTGLDLLMLGRQQDLPLSIVLHSLNPATIWYFVILSLGLSRVAGLSRREAVSVSIATWACGVGLVAGFALFAGDTSIHLRFGAK